MLCVSGCLSFGGYTTLPWNNGGPRFPPDPKTFMFLLRAQQGILDKHGIEAPRLFLNVRPTDGAIYTNNGPPWHDPRQTT